MPKPPSKSTIESAEIRVYHNRVSVNIRRRRGEVFYWRPVYQNVTPSSLCRLAWLMLVIGTRQRRATCQS